MQRFGAIIFDLDGTLLDTLTDLAVSVNCVLIDAGYPVHPVDAYRNFVGDGAAMLIERVLPQEERSAQNVQALLKRFLEIYSHSWRVNTRPYPGVPSMLDQLTSKGIPMAVLSNKPHDLTLECVNTLLPRWRFGAILGERTGIPRKPDPAGAHQISRDLGVAAAQFAFLGDSAVDMRTAAAAGMFPVGALWGFQSEQQLREAGAKALIREPIEILY